MCTAVSAEVRTFTYRARRVIAVCRPRRALGSTPLVPALLLTSMCGGDSGVHEGIPTNPVCPLWWDRSWAARNPYETVVENLMGKFTTACRTRHL